MHEPSVDDLKHAARTVVEQDAHRLHGLEQAWQPPSDASEPEISAESIATFADLWNCYRLLLNRAPDPVGAPHLIAMVRKGISVHGLVKCFVDSHEFVGKYRPPPHDLTVRAPVNGLDLFLPAPRTEADFVIRATGRYRPHMAGAIASVLAKGSYVLDIGAGAGEFAMQAARLVGVAGRVIAWEPDAANMRPLLANIAALALDNVDVLPFAAADGDGFICLERAERLATARDITEDDLLSSDGAIVYARTIDSVMPPGQRVDVVNLALDGFDHRALEGASATLAEWRPHLFLRYAPALLERFSGIDPLRYLRLLRDAGYDHFVAIPYQGPALDLGSDGDALAAQPQLASDGVIDFYAAAR